MGELENINKNDEDRENLIRETDRRTDYADSHEGIYDIKKLLDERDEFDRLLKEALERECNKDEIIEQFRAMLNMISSECKCKKCDAPIWFIKSKNNVFMPITENGLNHFGDCEFAKDFKKDKGAGHGNKV